MNKNMRKTSEAVLKEEQELLRSLEADSDRFKESLARFEAGAQERERRIWELDVKAEEEFVDFFKKLNVHEISLIRNIQYDIDNMIKKTDIFNWQNTSAFQDRFNLRTNDQVQLAFADPYYDFKLAIVKQDEVLPSRTDLRSDQARLAVLKERLGDRKEAEEMLQEIRKNYAAYRAEVCEFIESFRKSGQFKFEAEEFKFLVFVFREVLRAAVQATDF